MTKKESRREKKGYNDLGFDSNSARDSSPLDIVEFDEASKEVGVEAAGFATLRNGFVDAQFVKPSAGHRNMLRKLLLVGN